jgi:hypothetical protein
MSAVLFTPLSSNSNGVKKGSESFIKDTAAFSFLGIECMRLLLTSVLLGGLGALLLLMLAFLAALRSGFMWLSELAFYPGDHLYPLARESGMLEMSEGLHHQFVLLASLSGWWLVLTVSVYAWRRARARL